MILLIFLCGFVACGCLTCTTALCCIWCENDMCVREQEQKTICVSTDTQTDPIVLNVVIEHPDGELTLGK